MFKGFGKECGKTSPGYQLRLSFLSCSRFSTKIAEKCSTSNVIKEQLNWIITYLNLGVKVVFFPWGNRRHFFPLSSWPTGKPTSTPTPGTLEEEEVGWGGVGSELPHENDSRCSSSRLDGRDCPFLSDLRLFRTENQYIFFLLTMKVLFVKK